jgi:outer membrane protein assembly factor BamB
VPPVWHQWIPVRVLGMVVAGDHLFVAGPPDIVSKEDPCAAFEGRLGATVWALDKKTGTKLSELPLPSPPVFDGLIAANGNLYISTVDGKVLCLRGELPACHGGGILKAYPETSGRTGMSILQGGFRIGS